MRFLDLARCSQSNLSTFVFDAPGVRSGSVSSTWVSGGEISRFLVRCSQNDLFTLAFDAPGARSGSVSSRWVSGGEISRFGEVLSK